ncbi:MAG: chorismate mutase [Stomatobaculum sp.]|nr:chorismate mutase [Stomatobaculum sp.]
MDLKEARKEIDRIDRQMVELLRERLGVCDEIAKYKGEHGLPLTDAAREREKLCEVSELIGEELSSYAVELYSVIFEICKKRQADYCTGDSKETCI